MKCWWCEGEGRVSKPNPHDRSRDPEMIEVDCEYCDGTGETEEDEE